jgi:hypothetical protein
MLIRFAGSTVIAAILAAGLGASEPPGKVRSHARIAAQAATMSLVAYTSTLRTTTSFKLGDFR